jgi:glucose-6-phosphate isomerase
MALRAPDGADWQAVGRPVSAGVEAVRGAMAAFVADVREGRLRGATGKAFTTVLHIGIGGSDLGPRMVWRALKPLVPQVDVAFVGNVDPADIAAAMSRLDPETTLVVVASKTFTTQETMANAAAARAWLREALGEGADSHFAACSTNLEACAAFGIPASRVFGFEDWVGGRYSIWSAVGLSVAVGLGWDAFADFLAGAAAMDAHFKATPLERNAPVLLALAHVFNRNGLGRPVRVVEPYSERLGLLAAYLQQLEMESNGKRVTEGGAPVSHATSTAVFGNAGTSGTAASSGDAPTDLLTSAAHVRGCRTVVLAGGCFQNALLLEQLTARLRRRGLQAHVARAVPGNDGGLALGQVWACRGLPGPDRAPGAGAESIA